MKRLFGASDCDCWTASWSVRKIHYIPGDPMSELNPGSRGKPR